jgi:hypothetical protein
MSTPLDRYLHGELSIEEERALQELLAKDDNLRREMVAIQELHGAFAEAQHSQAPHDPDLTNRVMRSLPLAQDSVESFDYTYITRWLHNPMVDWLVDHLSPRRLAHGIAFAALVLVSSLSFIGGTYMGRVTYVAATPTLVPLHDILPGVALTPELFTIQYIPTHTVPAQAIQSPKDLEGRYAHSLILAHHPLDARYTLVAESPDLPPLVSLNLLRQVQVTLELPADQLSLLKPGATLNLVLAIDDSVNRRVTPLSSQATLINLKSLDSPSQRSTMQRVEATVVVPTDEAAKIDFGKQSGTVAVMLPS